MSYSSAERTAMVESMTEEFDGEDVLHARARDPLEDAKASLNELHEQVAEYTGAFELPEPDDDLRAAVLMIVENEVAHVPTR